MQDWETYAAHFSLTRLRDPVFLRLWMDRVAEVAGVRAAALPPGPWLDAGAGTGRFSPTLAEYWKRDVVAVEPQPAMIAARAPHPGVRWVRGDLRALPLRARSCAGAWVHLVLHQIAEWPLAVRQLAGCIREGGLVAIRTIEPDDLEGHLLRDLFPEVVALERRRLIPGARLAEELRTSGLTTTLATFTDERDTPRDAFVHKIEGKSLSTLQLLDGEAFAAGVARMHARFPPGSPPIREIDRSVLVIGRRP